MAENDQEFTRAQPTSGGAASPVAHGRRRVKEGDTTNPGVSVKHAAIGVDYLEALGALDSPSDGDTFWSDVVTAAKVSSSKSDRLTADLLQSNSRTTPSTQTLGAPELQTKRSASADPPRRAAPQATQSTHIAKRPVVVTASASVRQQSSSPNISVRAPPPSSPAPVRPTPLNQVSPARQRVLTKDPSGSSLTSSTSALPSLDELACELDHLVKEVEETYAETKGLRKHSSRSTELSMSNDPFLLLSLDSMDLVDFPTTLTLNIVNGDACCHLTHLHLEDNKIVTLPPAIGQLHDLVELNVEGNLLTTLPRDMRNLKKLQRLHASNNKIAVIPLDLCECSSLRRLFLAGNRILKIPPEISKLQELRWLDMSSNLLYALPDEITALENLGWLDLTNNQISRLPLPMNNMQSLCSLHLLRNPLDQDDGLPLSLMELRNLQDCRIDVSLNFHRALLSERDPRKIHSFLTDLVMRFEVSLNDRSHWERDESTTKCHACHMSFTLTKRRHHCRICGRIFCHKDCSKSMDVPLLGSVRVCDPCYNTLDPSNPSNQYHMRRRKQAEEQAARTYGLTPADETLPVEHRIRVLKDQLVELDETIGSVRRTQDALQKMTAIYASDANSLDNAKRQIEEEKEKLRGLMLTKSRVEVMCSELEARDGDDGYETD